MTERYMRRNIATLLLLCITLVLPSCGRTASRIVGKSAAQVLKVDHMAPGGFINLSMYADGSSHIKDVTYRALDGDVYTQEFRDWHMLQGRIHWVSADKWGSLIRTRAITRVVGGSVDLPVPDDCDKILGVDVEPGTKNLVYLAKDGRILAKEYRDGMGERFAEGWLEIQGKG